MLKNYLDTAVRNLLKNKFFSFINIVGLALGMACSLLIWLWVADERAKDTFHVHDDKLYTVFQRIYHDGIVEGGRYTPALLAEEMKIVFPEVKYATGGCWEELHTFEANNKTLKQLGTFGSPDYFLVFSYPLLEGTPETAVKTTSDIAISRKMAETFFGSAKSAMGETIRWNNTKDFKVSAVFEDISSQSSQKFDYLLNWEAFLDEHQWAKSWDSNGPSTHIVLAEGTDVAAFEAKIDKFIDNYEKDENFVRRLSLQKYREVYLNSSVRNGEIAGGRIQYVRLFTIVAIVVLLIACINFMNLTTARSVKRGKEIGVRKVIGAVRSGLVRQFMGETWLIVLFAVSLALLIVALVLPAFNLLTQKEMALAFDDYSFWIAIFMLTTVTGFLAGSYPAFYLASFNPVKAFKGALKFGTGTLWFRKGLVVFQFTLSMMLIIGTIVISRQVHYIQSANLGFDRDNFIFVPLEGDLGKKFDVFKTELLTMPGINLISRMSDPPTNIQNGTGGVEWEGKDPNSKLQFTQAAVGYDFVKTMNLALLDGRDFSREFASDSVGYLVNEAALRIIGYKEPVGKPLTFWGRPGTIIGVLKDFHVRPLNMDIRPLILRLEESPVARWALIRTEPGQTREAVASIETVHKKLNPEFPLSYQFSDEEFQKLYGNERIVQTLSNVFAGLAIAISCLGLLGLAMFTAEQRTKEIGIRKVLGASLTSLFGLLSKELFILIGISFMIASPLGYYIMEDWLQEYAYHVGLGWWIFFAAGAVTLIIALVTVAFQTIRALLVNPATTLRAE